MECNECPLYQRDSVTQRKINSGNYIQFALVHIMGIPVRNLRTEANYTSLPEIMHKYSSAILTIQLM